MADVPELLVKTFLAGEEGSTELTARLAWACGYPLADIYESLRVACAAADPESAAGRSFSSGWLDEALSRTAVRLAPSQPQPCVPQALVIATRRRGVPAAINHLLNDGGLPTMTFDLSYLVACCRSGGDIEEQFPALSRVIVDAGECGRSEAEAICRALREIKVVGGTLDVAVLLEESAAATAVRGLQTPRVSVVANLPELMGVLRLHARNPLTVRERGVLECAAGGATNQQAARALGISIATVKTYLERAQGKLQSVDRASAVASAIRRGWL